MIVLRCNSINNPGLMNVARSCSLFGSTCVFFAEDGHAYVWGNYTGLGETLRTIDKPTFLPPTSSFPTTSQTLTAFLLNRKPPSAPTSIWVKQVATSFSHVLVCTTDGEVYSWGINSRGELGIGDKNERSVPHLVKFPNQEKVTAVFCGGNFSAAITEDGSLYTWGSNSDGQLGIGSNDTQTLPTKVDLPSPSPVIDVACGFYHMLALTKNNILWVWGHNIHHELGLGVREEPIRESSKPIRSPLKKVARIWAGSSFSLAQTLDGTLYAWGWNYHGACALSTRDDAPTPTRLPLPSPLVDLAVGGNHALALLEDGALYGWGYNYDYQLGLGDKATRMTPTKIIGPPGSEKRVLLRSSGSLFDDYFVPETGSRISNFGASCAYSWVLIDDGSLYFWGQGDGLGISSKTPKLYKNLKCRIPTCEKIFIWWLKLQWLWLGREDENTELFEIPQEILFHVVSVVFQDGV
jgi:alpha-tubulin suppressor-like RCC1 family protein